MVEQFLFVINLLLVFFPGFSVGRIGEHIAKGFARKIVFGNRVAVANAARVHAFDNQVRLANGIGFRTGLGSRKLDCSVLYADAVEVFSAFRQHATRTASGVKKADDFGQVGFYRFKNKVCQERNCITGSKVFPRFFVILFVELAEKFFENCTHADIGQCRQSKAVGIRCFLVGQVDASVGYALNDGEQSIVVGQFPRLAVILKIFEHIANVVAVAVQIFDKVIVKDIVVVGRLGLNAI